MKYISTIFEKVILFSLHKSKGGSEYFIGVQNKEIQFDWVFLHVSKVFFDKHNKSLNHILLLTFQNLENFGMLQTTTLKRNLVLQICKG